MEHNPPDALPSSTPMADALLSDCWNFGFSKGLERLHATFTADQQVAHFAIGVGAGGDRDGFF